VVDKLGGTEILSDMSHYCIYETFKDLWLTEKQRKNLILQGIGMENHRLRAGAGNADKTEKTQNAVFKACRSKHYIPIDFDVCSDCKRTSFVRSLSTTLSKWSQPRPGAARLCIPLSSLARSRLTT
jgi:hypothetical protein